MRKLCFLIAIFISCMLCFTACQKSPDEQKESTTAVNINIHESETENTKNANINSKEKNVFISPVRALKFGYVSCYTNPQDIQDEENEENLYGVATSDGKIVLEPKYKEAYPINESVFAVKFDENGKTLSTMVDKDGKPLVDAFEGEVEPVFEDQNDAVSILRYYKDKCVLVDEKGSKILNKEFTNVFGTDFNQNFLEAYDENNAYFISNYGKIIATFPKNEIVADPFSDLPNDAETVIAACYSPDKYGQSIRFGIYNKSTKEIIVPCERNFGYAINSTRFVLQDVNYMGLDLDGFAAIYDEKGNVICNSGTFQEIDFEPQQTVGVGIQLTMDHDSGETALKYWKIDTDGNKLSDALDSRPEINQ